MIHQHFGWTGVSVPLVGQGTWKLPTDPAGEARALESLEAGIELGATHVDTAEMYGRGRSEELVSRLLARHRREDLFLVSKVLPSNATWKGTLDACGKSLARLGTDHLDVYLLHWRGSVPLDETFRAMEELVRAGRTRFVGVSNFDVGDLDEAQRALGSTRLACNQLLYHLGARGIENELVPYCQKHGIAVVGYSPFGSGEFPAPSSEGGRVLGSIAHRIGCTPRQVALRFLVREPALFTIPKASSPEHARENARAASLTLTAEDLRAIDRAFPRPPSGTPLETL